MRGFGGRSLADLPFRAGKETATTGASGTTTTIPVTFDPPFAVGIEPSISANVVTAFPGVNDVEVGTATNTGVNIYLIRNASSATLDIYWQAQEMTQ